jgi:hypothetical protein
MQTAARVRCPECITQDQRSNVYPDGTMSTLMCVNRFHDEDGHLHRHDPNTHTTGYRCSNGHRWHDRIVKPCPIDDCTFNERSAVHG